MKKLTFILIGLLGTAVITAQQPAKTGLSVIWEELTAAKFAKAVELSYGVCIIPIGVYEKHGPHLPLGTDLYQARAIARKAAEKEYAVVFPTYYFSQINEARTQPGTIAFSPELLWQMLEETCDEISRNGLKKIILFNGHGGNARLLTYFLETRLNDKKDYNVVLFSPGDDPNSERAKELRELKKTTHDGHAGESETSNIYYLHPELVDIAAIPNESGADQKRLEIPQGTTGNGFNWYASYPNHYMGDGSVYSKRLGELQIARSADQLAELIKFMKTDNTLQQIKAEFFNRADDPKAYKIMNK
jgi:creatinine amidohydrolase